MKIQPLSGELSASVSAFRSIYYVYARLLGVIAQTPYAELCDRRKEFDSSESIIEFCCWACSELFVVGFSLGAPR